MPRMGWGCKKIHLENIFRNFQKTKSRSSAGFPARADKQTKVPARAEISPLERVTQHSARAYIHLLERTDEQCKMLDARFIRSSAHYSARADCNTGQKYWEFDFPARSALPPLERKAKIWKTQIRTPSPKPSFQTPKSILLGPFSGKLFKTHNVTWFQVQFVKSKPKGSLIKLISKSIFKNHAWTTFNMTCMHSNQFKVPMWCSNELNTSKIRWKHGFVHDYEHACVIWLGNQLKTQQYQHACKDWASIQHFWTKTCLSSTMKHESCKMKLKDNKKKMDSLT